MININLLKYLNKTFSEIYELEHRIAAAEEKAKKISLTKIYIIFGTVLLLFAIAVTYFLILHDVNENYQTKESLKKEDNLSIKIDKTEKSIEEIEGFKQIGSIQFKEESEIKTEEKSAQEDLKIKEEEPLKTEKKFQPIKKEEPSTKSFSVAKPINKYSIKIENLSEEEYLFLKNRVKDKLLKADKRVENIEKWQVFVEEKGGDKYIGQLEVRLEKEFSDKTSAVKFAKSLNKKVIVKKVDYDRKVYNIEIASFDSLEEAKNYIKNLDIKGKIIKLVKTDRKKDR
jgi:hypothetical protein